MAEFLASISLFPLVLTLGSYQIGLWCQKKTKSPICNPLLIATLICMVVLLLTGCGLLPTSFSEMAGDTVTISREEYDRLKRYEELDELLQIVDTYYYQEPDHQAMLDNAAQGLLYGLDDPYTFYYTPEDYAAMWEEEISREGYHGPRFVWMEDEE